jgi:hypothetical protein
MKCPGCQMDVPVTARSCPNCSHCLIKEQDIKSSKEVSVEWLMAIFEACEYRIDDKPENPLMFIAYHKDKPTLVLELIQSINIISIQSYFIITKLNNGQKSELLDALNRANSFNRLGIYSVNDSMNDLGITTFIYLTEQISTRDIAIFIDLFNESVWITLKSSGLVNY